MLFILIVLIALSLLYGYTAWRVIPKLSLTTPWVILLWTIVVILAVFSLLGPALSFSGHESRVADAIAWIGYTGMGFFVLLLIGVALRDLGWLTWLGGSRLFGKTELIIDPSRRQFLASAVNLGLISLTGGITAYGFSQARRPPQVIEVNVPLKNLSPGLEGLRIVQLSDLHVGPTIKHDYVQQVVDQVQKLQPDLIAFTGDLVDGSVNWLSDDVAPLADLSAPYGKYFITGNHEYYSGVEHWLEKTTELGFDNLVNQHRLLEIKGGKLTIAGVNDYEAARVHPVHATNPEQALHNAPIDSTKILLAHQPTTIYAAQHLGVDLVLAGHTHGGQFKPFHLAVNRVFEYVAGLHDHKGTWIYVNSGTGYWGPPLRLGIPNEITVLTLKKD